MLSCMAYEARGGPFALGGGLYCWAILSFYYSGADTISCFWISSSYPREFLFSILDFTFCYPETSYILASVADSI